MIKMSASENSFFNIKESMSDCSLSSNLSTLEETFEDVEAPRMLRKVGIYGKKPGCFKYPCGIAVTGDNSVIVADNRIDNSLQIFNDGGDLSMATQCVGAADVAALPGGDIAVACYTGATWLRNIPGVKIYDQSGANKALFSGVSSAAGICVNSRGEYLVTDQSDLCVTVMDKTGKVIRKIGKKGSEPHCFRCPVGICTNSRDDVIVTDMKKHCLIVFDKDGNFLKVIGRKGKATSYSPKPGMFWAPERICIDKEDRIYVADSKNCRIQVLSDSGEPKRCFPLKKSGKTSSLKPIAVDITKDDNLLVACVSDSVAELRTYQL